jgi:hypothetical protein
MMNTHNIPLPGGPARGAGSPGPPPRPGPPANPAADGPAAIDAAVAALAYLDSAPTASHVAVFEHVHLTLTDALAAIDGV